MTAVWVRAAPLEALAGGVVHVAPMPADARGLPREALVMRDELGGVRAYLNRCEHLPNPLDGGSREFLDSTGTLLRCGTHGALFRREDGLCIEGPCRGRSLAALPFRVHDGWVEVDAT